MASAMIFWLSESSPTDSGSMAGAYWRVTSPLSLTVAPLIASPGMAGGFWLNNQLTDFSLVPVIDGKPVANAVAPRKAVHRY